MFVPKGTLRSSSPAPFTLQLGNLRPRQTSLPSGEVMSWILRAVLSQRAHTRESAPCSPQGPRAAVICRGEKLLPRSADSSQTLVRDLIHLFWSKVTHEWVDFLLEMYVMFDYACEQYVMDFVMHF